MRLSLGAIAFVAVIAAAATAEDAALADKRGTSKSKGNEVDFPDSRADMSPVEKAMSAYMHDTGDGSGLQEFEGYLVSVSFRSGSVLRLQFPNGMAKNIINLPPINEIGWSGGKEKIMVAGSLVDNGSTIDALGNMPQIVAQEFHQDDHQIGATDTRTVLVVRVIATDNQTTATAEELSDDIFGTGTADQLSVKEQFDNCSYGQLQLNAMTQGDHDEGTGSDTIGTGLQVGTTEVNINIPANGVDIYFTDFEDTVTMAVNTQFGVTSPEEIADFVMYCVPAGVLGGGLADWAYAYTNIGVSPSFQSLSVYSDGSCTELSTVMHEIGHNMNLDHSSEHREEYGDEVGMMGYSYGDQDAPRKCFNAPKSSQLGWYSDHEEDFTGFSLPGNDCTQMIEQQIDLVGLAEYDLASNDQKVIIKIPEPSKQRSFYVMYNRAIGVNSGTDEAVNLVAVTRQVDQAVQEDHYSFRLAELGQGESFTEKSFSGTGADLTITVNSLSTSGAAPDVASVTVKLGGCSGPTIEPTWEPTWQTTWEPTKEPSCSDSPLRLKIFKEGASKPITRSCEWVKRTNTAERCNLTGVSAACPVTCRSCDTCADPELRFKFTYNNNNIARSCEFVGRIEDKVNGRCAASQNICRETCGAC